MNIKTVRNKLKGLLAVLVLAFGITMLTPAIASVGAAVCSDGSTATSQADCPSSLESGAD